MDFHDIFFICSCLFNFMARQPVSVIFKSRSIFYHLSGYRMVVNCILSFYSHSTHWWINDLEVLIFKNSFLVVVACNKENQLFSIICSRVLISLQSSECCFCLFRISFWLLKGIFLCGLSIFGFYEDVSDWEQFFACEFGIFFSFK